MYRLNEFSLFDLKLGFFNVIVYFSKAATIDFYAATIILCHSQFFRDLST